MYQQTEGWERLCTHSNHADTLCTYFMIIISVSWVNTTKLDTREIFLVSIIVNGLNDLASIERILKDFSLFGKFVS